MGRRQPGKDLDDLVTDGVVESGRWVWNRVLDALTRRQGSSDATSLPIAPTDSTRPGTCASRQSPS